jgi:hypothetical protein
MKITLDISIPNGFEATGEFRNPMQDEFFLTNSLTACRWNGGTSGGYYIILRKLPSCALCHDRGYYYTNRNAILENVRTACDCKAAYVV